MSSKNTRIFRGLTFREQPALPLDPEAGDIALHQGVLVMYKNGSWVEIPDAVSSGGGITVSDTTSFNHSTSKLKFDNGSGFILSSLSDSVLVGLGSHFKTIHGPAGQPDIVAIGEDAFSLANGSNVTITTDSSTKTITIAATGGGGGGGTVTAVSATGPLSVANPTTTPSITIAQADGSHDGYVTQGDWNTFNGKEPAQTKGNIATATSGITITNGSAATVGPNVSVNIATATSSAMGLLSSGDWSTFNAKEPAQTKGSVSTSTTGVTVGNGSAATVGPNVTVDIATASSSAAGLLSSSDWNTFNSKLSSVPDLDASKITSGTIDIARIPAAALERLVLVTTQSARYALTISTVQLGDTVKQTDDNSMWMVVDTANLGNAAGYQPYTAATASSVEWSGVASKPAYVTQAADASHDGYLTQGNWSTFNSKEPAQTKGSVSTSTTGVTIGNGTAATVGPNVTMDIATAGSSATGLLTSSDWNTFNGKQAALVGGTAGQYLQTTGSSITWATVEVVLHTTATSQQSNYVAVKAPTSGLASSWTLTLPAAVGAANQALTTSNGTGATTWTSLNSGTYSPTPVTGTNVTAVTANTPCWMRVGNTVHVSGVFTVTTTAGAATNSVFYLPLPVASTMTSFTQLSGVGSYTLLNAETYSVVGDAVNNRAEIDFKSNNTAARNVIITFSYTVQ